MPVREQKKEDSEVVSAWETAHLTSLPFMG